MTFALLLGDSAMSMAASMKKTSGKMTDGLFDLALQRAGPHCLLSASVFGR